MQKTGIILIRNRQDSWSKNLAKCICCFATLFLMGFATTTAQPIEALRLKIQQLLSTKNAMVGVSISGKNGEDTLSINGDAHFPLQSVFKFHIALFVLSQVDQGKLLLQQKIKIAKQDLLPNLYSPIRDKYPNGTTLSLAKILQYTVCESDNVGCDLLLKMIGGPQVVEDYFLKNNFKDVSIKINEQVQQANWEVQFQNWTTPKAATHLLSTFYINNPRLLSQKSYRFIWETMKATQTGEARLKGLLPKGVTVAHKTGSSGVNSKGITAAVNDIGLVFLPNGHSFFISVFVSDSKEDAPTNEKIIAEIAAAAWSYFTNLTK